MTNVGFFAGGTVLQVGPMGDMLAFLDCVERYVVREDRQTDYTLITITLGMRYLRVDQLGEAMALFRRSQERLHRVATKDADMELVGPLPDDTRLDRSQPTLGDVFDRHFRAFDHACKLAMEEHRHTIAVLGEAEASKIARDPRATCDTVFLLVTEMPRALMFLDLTLEDFDEHEDLPFWMTDELPPHILPRRKVDEEVVDDGLLRSQSWRRVYPQAEE